MPKIPTNALSNHYAIVRGVVRGDLEDYSATEDGHENIAIQYAFENIYFLRLTGACLIKNP